MKVYLILNECASYYTRKEKKEKRKKQKKSKKSKNPVAPIADYGLTFFSLIFYFITDKTLFPRSSATIPVRASSSIP
jgi:protein involved in sex pheromone biosynthesis